MSLVYSTPIIGDVFGTRPSTFGFQWSHDLKDFSDKVWIDGEDLQQEASWRYNSGIRGFGCQFEEKILKQFPFFITGWYSFVSGL